MTKASCPESLEETLDRQKIKFIYLVTTFQNPTGRTLSASRRWQVAEIVQRHGALVIEDDPYSDLRYRGEAVPPFYTFAPENTVYVSTVSKVFAPGLRLGFCVAPAVIHEWLYTAKQGADLHSNTYAQALATEYICSGTIYEQAPKIIELYGPRLEAMLAAMDQYMPADYRWTQPDGGMFVWVEGPKGVDAEQIYWQAVERKVAFVPGKYFYIKPGRRAGDHAPEFHAIRRRGDKKRRSPLWALSYATSSPSKGFIFIQLPLHLDNDRRENQQTIKSATGRVDCAP